MSYCKSDIHTVSKYVNVFSVAIKDFFGYTHMYIHVFTHWYLYITMYDSANHYFVFTMP